MAGHLPPRSPEQETSAKPAGAGPEGPAIASRRGTSRFFLVLSLLLSGGLTLWLALGLRWVGGEFLVARLFDLVTLAAAAALSYGASLSSRLRGWILSMRSGLVVLVIVAAVSLIGVVFTQGAAPEEYIERFGRTGYRILNTLGFLHIFHVWWYKGLLFLLTYLVTSCALRRAGGQLRLAFRPSFRPRREDYRGLPGPRGLRMRLPPAEAARGVGDLLRQRGYRSVRQEAGDGGRISLFASRGGISRLGTLALHLSLALILAGGYVASMAGFRYLKWAGVGDIFRVRGAGFEVRVDSLRMEVTPEGRVKDYLAGLTVLDGGREALSKVIEVNAPLKYRGINIYQSSYATDPRAVREAGFRLVNAVGEVLAEDLVLPFRRPVILPELGLTLETTDFAADFVIEVNTGEVRSRSSEPRNPAIRVRYDPPQHEPYEEWLFMSGMDAHRRADIPYRLGFRYYEPEMLMTGLEVAYQPGLMLVWVGFGLMAVGSVLSFYFNHRRVWMLIEAEESEGETVSRLSIGGSSNRDPQGWGRTLDEWGGIIKQWGLKEDVGVGGGNS